MFISFSICSNNFTSLAYEIFYARKVDLFDKIKEVVFFPSFSVCEEEVQFKSPYNSSLECAIIKINKKFPLKKNKKKPFCHAALTAVLDEIQGAASSAVLSARKLKFWQQASFKPIWCTSYSEF
jgi:hypothetical protein